MHSLQFVSFQKKCIDYLFSWPRWSWHPMRCLSIKLEPGNQVGQCVLQTVEPTLIAVYCHVPSDTGNISSDTLHGIIQAVWKNVLNSTLIAWSVFKRSDFLLGNISTTRRKTILPRQQEVDSIQTEKNLLIIWMVFLDYLNEFSKFLLSAENLILTQ